MTWTAIAVNRFKNGKIAERSFNSDVFGMLQQFGLIPQDGRNGAGRDLVRTLRRNRRCPVRKRM